jgi:hypothetical protein
MWLLVFRHKEQSVFIPAGRDGLLSTRLVARRLLRTLSLELCPDGTALLKLDIVEDATHALTRPRMQ